MTSHFNNELFSWPALIEQAKQIHLRRAKTQAKSQCNTDYNIKHVDECRDAQKGNYVKLINRIDVEHQKYQKRNMDRMIKIGRR